MLLQCLMYMINMFYLEANDIEKGFKLGVATGSASAFSEGLATKDYVYELLNQIN